MHFYILLYISRNGTKYILRTDIMYERTSGEEINQQEEKALIMVQKAEILEVSAH